MNLERRTFLVIFVTLVVATGLAFAAAQAIVFRSVQGLEEDGARQNVERAEQALRHEIEAMAVTGADWANSDDTFRYVQEPDGGGGRAARAAYEERTIAPSAFRDNRIAVMVFLDSAGRVLNATGHDAVTGRLEAVPAAWLDPRLLDALRNGSAPDGSQAGAVEVGGRLALVAAWPIRPTDGTSPPAGTLVWGRPLDDRAVAALRRLTLLDVSIEPWDVGASRSPRIAALADLPGPAIEPVSSSLLTASQRFDDILGQPVLVIHVDMARPVYEQSVQNLAFGLASTILVGGGILVLITMMLDRTVFTPLHQLTRDVEGLSPDATGGRVSSMRDDEIGQLAQSFNRLMGRLDHNKMDLQRSNQDLRDFAAVVSHDLQPPLSTIALNAAVVRERERGKLGPDAMHRLDRLEGTALRMAEHIRSILDYSRVSSADAPMADVNLNEVMEEVVNDLEERLHATGGRIEYRSMPRVQGNRTQLTQLLLNLMGNALKYHRPGVPPVVKVHTEPYTLPAGAAWRLVVEDNGVGFDPADLDKMLRPYTRMEHRVEGYGLGLATCHKIVERHHGRLSAHSQPGQGSAFMVDLPTTQPVDPDAPPRDAPAA